MTTDRLWAGLGIIFFVTGIFFGVKYEERRHENKKMQEELENTEWTRDGLKKYKDLRGFTDIDVAMANTFFEQFLIPEYHDTLDQPLYLVTYDLIFEDKVGGEPGMAIWLQARSCVLLELRGLDRDVFLVKFIPLSDLAAPIQQLTIFQETAKRVVRQTEAICKAMGSDSMQKG